MAGKKRNKIRITFNAPVTLCFALVCALVLAVDYLTKGRAVQTVFSSGGGKACAVPFDFSSLFSYLRLFLHVFGSLNFTQFVSNFAFILLLGPMLEEKYGSPVLALMMAVTALVSGVVNACFGQGVLSGAGDIAFMMVLLSAFTSFSKNEIPLSFILVVVLYIGREIPFLTVWQELPEKPVPFPILQGACAEAFLPFWRYQNLPERAVKPLKNPLQSLLAGQRHQNREKSLPVQAVTKTVELSKAAIIPGVTVTAVTVTRTHTKAAIPTAGTALAVILMVVTALTAEIPETKTL